MNDSFLFVFKRLLTSLNCELTFPLLFSFSDRSTNISPIALVFLLLVTILEAWKIISTIY